MSKNKNKNAQQSLQRRQYTLARFTRKKICPIAESGKILNYKDVDFLKQFLTENGKIVPRRITGVSAANQRSLAHAIRRARNMALLPFAGPIVRSSMN